MLTGNGVAFILSVPGTEHGDWWSLNGWWIFVGTAAVSLLSKYVIEWRGNHVFNPSNFGLVLCFLLLGRTTPSRSTSGGGRCHSVDGARARDQPRRRIRHPVAPAAARGRASRSGWGSRRGRRARGQRAASMVARWHLGPVSGGYLWRMLVTSAEVMVFLFFMITDPKTAPRRTAGAER